MSETEMYAAIAVLNATIKQHERYSEKASQEIEKLAREAIIRLLKMYSR